jgi:choline dehydrogenase-like flavoprotein
VFNWSDFQPTAPEGTFWDVVIIGAGMGGGVLGWSLAKRNASVLYLERGPPVEPSGPPVGARRLLRLLQPGSKSEELAAGARWNRRISVRRDNWTSSVYLPMGNGPGGSSAVYGAALERLRRVDFAGVSNATLDPPPLPNRWPIDYDDFIPYYERAEELLGVRGTRDPTDPDDKSVLLTPPPLSERDTHFFESFEAAGLAPYRLHVGIEYKPGCTECLGILCARDCKSEGASRGLKPSLTDHNAKLLTGFEVERLVASTGDRVDEVVGLLDGREVKVRGRIIVLAAGALNTPAIMLNSTSEHWPAGVGNGNGLVGRGLMIHVSEFFALWPTREVSSAGPGKTLSSRALNEIDGMKLGGIQSVGVRISTSHVSGFLEELLQRILPIRLPALKIVTYAAAIIASRIFRGAALFATIMEDFAYFGNRVVLDSTSESGVSVLYRTSKDLARRETTMRQLIRDHLAKHRPIFLSNGDKLNYGHPSGTCRFGTSPATSVLNPENRVHGVSNLYVADASCFPSSGGCNPSLTVAANALRVADVVYRQLRGDA